jgi:pimeloyl-ACP methyl ester carboxylesterase
MGASVAQDFIIAYPERVNNAILISAGINGYEKKFPIDSVSMAWYPRFTNALNAKDTARAALEFTKTWGEGIDHRGDSLIKPASKYVYNTTLATLKQYKMEGWPNLQNNPPAMEGLAGIKLPVLIIHGDKDLPYITTASEYMEKTIPGAKRVLLKDVAHMLNMEKPAEVNRLMIEFLQSK